ncbi:hypothetical protein ACEPPN_008407 [Leptodophora sp. 'Broadleaf-Isolate-01']
MKLSPLLWLTLAAGPAIAKVQCPDAIETLKICCPKGFIGILSQGDIITGGCVGKYLACCSGAKPADCEGLAGVTVVEDPTPASTF